MIQTLIVLVLTVVTVYFYTKYRLIYPSLMAIYASLMCVVITIVSTAIRVPKGVESFVLMGGIIGITVVAWDTLGRLPRRKRNS